MYFAQKEGVRKEGCHSIGGQNGSSPGKPSGTPASRTFLVTHVASAGLEPTPDTAVNVTLQEINISWKHETRTVLEFLQGNAHNITYK